MRYRVIDGLKPDRLEMLPAIKVTSQMRQRAQRLADTWAASHGDNAGRNFKYIGGGSFRTAYRHGDLVYKIGEIDGTWYGDNLAESKFVRVLREDGWGWFVPDVRTIAVSVPGYNVNVMQFFDGESSYRDGNKLSRSIAVMLHEEYGYNDASGYNLLIRRDNGLPVLVDAGIMNNDYQSLDNRQAA